MKLIVDARWLADPSRVYPITVDPTIVHDTTAEFAAGYFDRVKDTGSGSAPFLESYYGELPTDQFTVGLWHLNEASGNALDSSGNGNTGTPTGTTIITGLMGNTRSFNGSSDYVSVPDSNSLDATTAITIESWVYWQGAGTGNSIVVYKEGTSSTCAYGLIVQSSSSKIIFGLNQGANWHDHISNTTIPINTWTHIAGTYNTSTKEVTIYINGVIDRIYSGETGNIVVNANVLSIGREIGQAAEYFKGSIDEVRISNIARTPEEIKRSASRRPSAVYTSPILDLTTASAWNPLTWTEYGVTTGDGETLKDATGLVAQWNFNETSGTTADNAQGTAALDGTLTNFASTTSQDQAAGTGWTANNKRWGAGALMLDGTNDYVSIPDNASLSPGSGNYSVNTWFKTSTAYTATGWLFSNYGSANNNTVGLAVSATTNQLACFYRDGSANIAQATGGPNVNDGSWHMATCSRQGTTVNSYLDGKLISTATNASLGTITTTGLAKTIGTYAVTPTTQNFYGVIDSLTLYSRALTSAEILSNYQSGQIDLQTRVGSSTDANDGTWESWKSITGETAIDSYDGPYQYNTSDSGLVSYWPMDETVDNSCSGGEDACDKKSTSHGTATGTKVADGKYSKGRFFAGVSDYISVPDSSNWAFGTSDFTISTWVNFASISGHKGILGQRQDAGNFMGLYWDASNKLYFHAIDGGVWRADYNFTWTPTINTWYHLTVVRSGTTFSMYLNGVPQTLTTTTAIASNSIGNLSSILGIGLAETFYMNGLIDEMQISNTAISATVIKQKYLEGTTRPDTLRPITDLLTKIEGSASQKIETGRPGVDGSTVALWHLDETGGTGAYLHDSSSYANHGTPTGTTVVNGISSKARSFNGTSDFVDAGNGSGLGLTNIGTLEAWIKPNVSSGNRAIVCSGILDTDRSGYCLFLDTNDKIRLEVASSTSYNITTGAAATAVTEGAWNHVVGVWNGSTLLTYINGIQIESVSQTVNATATNSTRIGRTGSGTGLFFPGSIDEVRISNTARTPEEVAESYRAGRDHYLNKTINSTDLSGKTSLPFYVAGDRPGAYLSATVGESAFANYQPDTSTVGLWHLDEQSGSGAYIKDSSGTGNHGTPTGTTSVQGKIGKARSFNGTSDAIPIPHSTTLKPATQISISAWVKPNTGTLNALREIYRKEDGTGRHLFAFQNAANCSGGGGTGGCLAFGITTGGVYAEFEPNIAATDWENAWHYVVATYDGTNKKIYKDGALLASVAATGVIDTSGTNIACIGASPAATCNGEWFSGLIDEVSISSIARTATEIRQAYEAGLRTHPITIDFGAKLDAGNLITGSGDLGFTIDATYYGLSQKGDSLYPGDKIIVKENYDGTEYIAQGTVTSVVASTGATTVVSWDSGSTFPSGGYTANASIFKWQREYWNVDGEVQDSSLDAITNLTLRLTDGNEGRTIYLDDLRSTSGYLTTPTGSTITSALGSRYFQYRAILTSSDEAVSPQLSLVTLDYVAQSAPATPSLDLPTDTATNQILLPALKTTATDANSDYVRYKIELCTNLAMSTGCQTFDQTSSQTGWSGQNAQTSTAYTSGTQATFTLSSPLLDPSTLYYWRSYAIDPAGLNTWSSTQATPYSFTTTTAPSAPTLPYAEGSANPTGVADTTPEFSAVHNDADSDAANKYEIEVNANNTFTGTIMWDSNQTAMASLANGVRSTDVSYAGSAIPLDGLGTTYYWRIRFTDVNSAVGAWSSVASFSMNVKPVTPTLSSPTNSATNIALLPTLSTTTTDPESDTLQYKYQVCTDLAMTANCQTLTPATSYASGSPASYTLASALDPLTIYYWRTYAIDASGSNTWSSTQGTPYSFTTRDVNESFGCLIHETADDSSLTVVWADREIIENSYKLEKSIDGGAFTAYQTLAANTTSYLDTSISDGHTYAYRVAPFLTTGSLYGDWCTTSTLSLGKGAFKFENIIFR